MRPGHIHPDWLAWFQAAFERAVANLNNKGERRKTILRWRRVLEGEAGPAEPGAD